MQAPSPPPRLSSSPLPPPATSCGRQGTSGAPGLCASAPPGSRRPLEPVSQPPAAGRSGGGHQRLPRLHSCIHTAIGSRVQLQGGRAGKPGPLVLLTCSLLKSWTASRVSRTPPSLPEGTRGIPGVPAPLPLGSPRDVPTGTIPLSSSTTSTSSISSSCCCCGCCCCAAWPGGGRTRKYTDAFFPFAALTPQSRSSFLPSSLCPGEAWLDFMRSSTFPAGTCARGRTEFGTWERGGGGC